MHLLTLDPTELGVVHDALVAFATSCDDEGDTSTAQIADRVSDRARALDSITSASFREWVRMANVGPWKGKPQG